MSPVQPSIFRRMALNSNVTSIQKANYSRDVLIHLKGGLINHIWETDEIVSSLFTYCTADIERYFSQLIQLHYINLLLSNNHITTTIGRQLLFKKKLSELPSLSRTQTKDFGCTVFLHKWSLQSVSFIWCWWYWFSSINDIVRIICSYSKFNINHYLDLNLKWLKIWFVQITRA